MTSRRPIIKEIKFIRVKISDMTVDEVIELLVSDQYSLFFGVYSTTEGNIRVVLPKMKTKDDALNFIRSGGMRRAEGGIDSDYVRIEEISFLDCYAA